ncbi:CHASE3 domain-containing protein [Nostoc sp. UHCC 0702]|nr:CHASE3 domain-containing protein [Nostoc sp. UHCC 0702]
MNRLSQKIVAGSFGLALMLLFGVAGASYLSIQRLTQEKQWVIHTYHVLEVLEKMEASLSNAEIGRHNYILTGKLVYLQTYQTQKQKVFQEFQTLRQLTKDNPNQQSRLDALEPLIALRFTLVEQTINLFKQNKLDKSTQAAVTVRGIEVREQLQAIYQAMEQEEKTLLQQRTAATDTSVDELIIVVALAYGLSLVLLIVVYFLLQKQIRINKALSEETIRLEQQAAKAKLADILETVTDAFIALDRNWCYTYINQRAGQIFQRNPEDLIGKNIWKEFPEGVGQKFYHAYYQAVAEQRIIEMEEYYPPWERWFENRIYPTPEGLSIFFQDITRRKLAEISLEKNERRYRSLVIATSQAVWIADTNGLLKDLSSWIALTGQSDAEAKGWGWLNAIHPEDRELTKLLWNQALESKNIYKTEHRLRVADGSYHDFAARAVPVLDANNETQEWVSTYTDISDRKKAEAALQQAKQELEIKVEQRTAELQKLNEELKRSNRELEQFAYVASHDLQEPLRAVTGYSQLLADEYKEHLSESAQEYLTYIVDGAKRMQQLIQDLLVYSRVGTRSYGFAPTDCNIILNQALNNLQVAIAESKAIITHDPLPTLLADKSQLVQLFQNLIGNAIKFRKQEPPQIHIGAVRRAGEAGGAGKAGGQGGRGAGEEFLTPNSSLQTPHSKLLTLNSSLQTPYSLLPTENEWLFWVQDNGIGIKSQYLERIFEVFRRLHTRREFPGTGIGLAICKKIVERHGGRIWAESQLGAGTIFYLTLKEN